MARNFPVSIENQLYGYFYCKDKNWAILLTLLVLALLLRKLSAMGGVVIHDSRKRYPWFQSISITVWPTPPPSLPPSSKKTKNKKQKKQTNKMEKNLPSQTIQPLSLPIRALSQLRAHLRACAALFGKKVVLQH